MRASSGEAPTARKLAQKASWSKTKNPTSPTRRSGLACLSWCSASSMPSDVADSAGAKPTHLDPSPCRLIRASARRASRRKASVATIAPAATTAGSTVRRSPPPPGRTPLPSRRPTVRASRQARHSSARKTRRSCVRSRRRAFRRGAAPRPLAPSCPRLRAGTRSRRPARQPRSCSSWSSSSACRRRPGKPERRPVPRALRMRKRLRSRPAAHGQIGYAAPPGPARESRPSPRSRPTRRASAVRV